MHAKPGSAPARKSVRPRRRRNLVADILPTLQDERRRSRREAYALEMMETCAKLLRDGTGLGDIKLLNAALREVRYALTVFAPYRHVRKVSAFGSARTPPSSPVYRAASEFARRIAAEGYMMITGAGGGIMRAYQEGAGRDRSFGVNIRLPFEQEPNEFIRDDPKLVTFRYFFTRKLIFMKEADAIVLFPGGFGTHDEGFEALTLVQTGKSRPMPIVFMDAARGTYWKTWKRYVEDHLLRRGLVSEEDMALFKVTSSVDEAVHELTTFYRVYHSSRNVGDRFVVRLQRPLGAATVDVLAKDFADIVLSGRIEQSGPLEEEREQEPELSHLSRLVFHFNRSSFGRLRQLIDRVNHAARDTGGVSA